MKKYTKEHEWIMLQGSEYVVGISDHAQEQLGDIVFVELPDNNKSLIQRDEAAVVESVKAASEVYAPISGEVVEVNETLVNAPETVNKDPEGSGWFFKIKPTDLAELDKLMDESEYKDFISG